MLSTGVSVLQKLGFLEAAKQAADEILRELFAVGFDIERACFALGVSL